MEDSLKRMEAKLDKLDQLDAIIEDLKTMNERYDRLEGRIAAVEDRLNDDLDELKRTLADDAIKLLREEFVEQRERLTRLTNIILYGVPENTAGLNTAENLVKILLPSFTGPLIDASIGPSPAASSTSKPRPLRVSLNNVNDQKLAMSNRGKLRGLDQFKGISLKKDLTKRQQQELKLQYESRQKELADSMLSLSDQPGASGTTRKRTRSSYSTDGRSKKSK